MERAMGIEPTSEAWDVRPNGSPKLVSRREQIRGECLTNNLLPFRGSLRHLSAEINAVADVALLGSQYGVATPSRMPCVRGDNVR